MRRQEQPTGQVGQPHSLPGKSGDGPDLGQLGQGLECAQVLGAGQAGASQQGLSVAFNRGNCASPHDSLPSLEREFAALLRTAAVICCYMEIIRGCALKPRARRHRTVWESTCHTPVCPALVQQLLIHSRLLRLLSKNMAHLFLPFESMLVTS